jgi:transketolase
MNIVLDSENRVEELNMKDKYAEAMIELAEKDKNVLAFDADLLAAIGMFAFREKFPERTIDVGIQEANMCGVAAGMAKLGFIPYIHTFGAFASRRMYDQIFMSGSYSKSNLKIIGSDPGTAAEYNGGTHAAMEDMALMRALPGMTLIDITDTVMLKDIMAQIKDIYGMFYLRVIRKSVNKVYKEGSTFDIGKAVTISEGKDVTIIAAGYCVSEAVKAAKMLEEKNISARVLDMFTIKPIDKEAIIKAAKETGAIVTAENHNVLNGLGSAVADVLVENAPVPMEKIGVQDIFGEVGPMSYLSERFELNAKYIAAKCEKAIARK